MAITGLIERTVDIDRGVQLTPMNQLFAASDEGAHTLRVSVLASGQPLALTGAGVFGYFIRADEETVVVRGTAAGHVATLVLPESCYAAPGRFSLIIKATLGDERKAIFWGDGFVTRASTDVIVDPGNEIPSLEELLAQIANIEAATKEAKDAASEAKQVTKDASKAAQDAQTATETAREVTDKWDNVSLEYEALPPSEEPRAELEQDEHSTKFKFFLPTSNLAYSTFEVDDDMQLIMTSPDGFSDIGFELTDDGDLEVVIN